MIGAHFSAESASNKKNKVHTKAYTNILLEYIATDVCEPLLQRGIANWFKHMMTPSNANIFRVTSTLCREFSGHKGQWSGALGFSMLCAWTNDWDNNRDAGDLKGHHAHYDETVMKIFIFLLFTGCFCKYISYDIWEMIITTTQSFLFFYLLMRMYFYPQSNCTVGFANLW